MKCLHRIFEKWFGCDTVPSPGDRNKKGSLRGVLLNEQTNFDGFLPTIQKQPEDTVTLNKIVELGGPLLRPEM